MNEHDITKSITCDDFVYADRLSRKESVVVAPRRFGHQLRNAVNELFDLLIHFELQSHLRTDQILKYLHSNTSI